MCLKVCFDLIEIVDKMKIYEAFMVGIWNVIYVKDLMQCICMKNVDMCLTLMSC